MANTAAPSQLFRDFQDGLSSWITTQNSHRLAANKQGLTAHRRDQGDLIWMPLSPLLQLLLIQLLPCSCNTDSAFLPARNEDKGHPLRPNPINFCKRAGENFLSNLRHQHHWARPADSDGGALYYPHKCLLPRLAAFSFPHFLYLACSLNPAQPGTKCKLKQ